MSNAQKVKRYYRTLESRLGYKFMLDDDRHFGYYPADQKDLSMHAAQELMNERLYEELAVPSGAKILDAGTGNGNVAVYLADKHRLHVSGIDLIASNVRNSLKKQQAMSDPGLVDFQEGTYAALPYADADFDGVYTMETFVHADDAAQVLKEFFRVLKPGGKLVLHEYYLRPDNAVTPEQKAAFARLQKLNLIAAMPLLNSLQKGSLGRLVSQADFQLIETRDYTEFTMPMMHQFARKSRRAFKFAELLHVRGQFDKHFVNAATAVISSDYSELVGYEVTICSKPKNR